MAGGNVLTGTVFDLLPQFAGPKIIYAAANRMDARAAREGITFNPDCSLGLWGNLEASFRHSEAMSNRSGSNGYH